MASPCILLGRLLYACQQAQRGGTWEQDGWGWNTEVIDYKRCKLRGWIRTWCIFLTSPTSTELYTLKIICLSPPPNRTPFWLVPNLGKLDFLPHHAFPLSPQPGSEVSAAKAGQFSRVAFLPTPPSQLPVAASPFLALLTSSPYLKIWKPL